MAYEKQTWTTGEVITAEKLNHMEDGIKDNENKDTIEVTFFTHCNNDSSIYLVSSSHTVEEVQAFIKAGKNRNIIFIRLIIFLDEFEKLKIS